MGRLLVDMLRYTAETDTSGRRIDIDEALNHWVWGKLGDATPRDSKRGRFDDDNEVQVEGQEMAEI